MAHPTPAGDLPFPKHLHDFVQPMVSASKAEHLFVGRLQCRCGAGTFRFFYPGETHEFQGSTVPCTATIDGAYFFLVRAACEGCGSEYLVIDQDLHGWNGVVCHDAAQAALERPPLTVWPCSRCRDERHRAVVTVTSQGKADFEEEAGPDFEPSQWAEGFESLSLDLVCQGCGLETSSWISCETM